MESGHGAAGNSYKQDREKCSQIFILESCKSRKIHGRMSKDQSKDRSCDHTDKHKGGHIISWLHKEPHSRHFMGSRASGELAERRIPQMLS